MVNDNGNAPATGGYVITPSDSTLLNPVPRGIFVGGGGNVYVDLIGGSTNVPFIGVVGGTILPVKATKVRAATTATSLTAMY